MRWVRWKQALRGVVGAVAVLATGPTWALPSQWTAQYIGEGTPAAINNAGRVVGNGFGAESWLHNGETNTVFLHHQLYDINDRGQVIGYDESLSLFVYADGIKTYFGDSTAWIDSRNFWKINNAGQAVGTRYSLEARATRAFWYDESGLRELGAAFCQGAVQCVTAAYAINDRAQAVGFGVRDGVRVPLLFEGESSFVELTTYGLAPNAYPRAIDNNGTIVGFLDPDRPFMIEGGEATYFAALTGYSNSQAMEINNLGQIVGFSAAGNPWVWENGTFFDLNALDVGTGGEMDMWFAFDINDRQQIIAYGQYGGRTGAFLLSPVVTAVPEPQTYLAMAIGLLILMGYLRVQSRAR